MFLALIQREKREEMMMMLLNHLLWQRIYNVHVSIYTASITLDIRLRNFSDAEAQAHDSDRI